MGSIENQVRDDPEIKRLAGEIFKILPTKDQVIEWFNTGNYDPRDDVVYSG
jgi:hypothetical protein